MVASSVGAGCSSLPGPFRQRVKVDPEAFGIVLSHSVPAIDPTLGPRSQARDRIGANGVMVIRLRMPSMYVHGACRLLQAAALFSEKLARRDNVSHFRKVLIDQTVPGSHRALPGTHGGGHSGRRTAPTAWTAPTAFSRHGKRVNRQLGPLYPRMAQIGYIRMH